MTRRGAVGLAGLAAVICGLAGGVAAAAPAADAAAASATMKPAYAPPVDLILEGGLALPLGDLADRYQETRTAFGQDLGHTVGVRLRVPLGSRWALSPSFHYTGYGEFRSTLPVVTPGLPGDPYAVGASLLAYGLDVQRFWRRGAAGAQPFVGAGLAVCRDRYRHELQTKVPVETRAAVNALALVLGAGVRMGNIELSLAWTRNRFTSARLVVPDTRTDYAWDGLVLRLGLVLPSVGGGAAPPPAEAAPAATPAPAPASAPAYDPAENPA